MVIELTDSNFKQEVLESKVPTLVDFWAPWCAPCRMVAPVVEEIANQYQGKLKVAKLNVDDAPVTASKYNVTSIPTLMVFENGKKEEQVIGALPKVDIEKIIKPHIK